MLSLALMLPLPLICALALCITGCKLVGTDPSAPNGFERLVFTTVTNYIAVPMQVTQTNIVTHEQVVYATNTVGQIVTVTNVFFMPEYRVVTITNIIPQYENKVNGGTTATIQAAGTAINTFLPGVGGIASSGLLALLGLWAQLRSSKRGQTNSTLAQEIETIREFIKSLPSGAKYDQAITAFLQTHQLESGVAQQVLGILQNQVDNQEAKTALQEIQNTLKVATTP